MRNRLANLAALTSLALCLAIIWIWMSTYRGYSSDQAELPSAVPRFLNYRGQLAMITYDLPRDLHGRVIHLSLKLSANAHNRILLVKGFVGNTTPAVAAHPSSQTVLARAAFLITLTSNPSLANAAGFGYCSLHPFLLRIVAKTIMPPVNDALHVLTIPDWFLMLILAILPTRAILRLHRARRASSQGRCPHCGYDLRATPARCPECGAMPAHASI